MSRIIDGAAPEVQDEFDRVWRASDERDQAVQALEARILRLETTRAPERPTRAVGDYLPDPERQLDPGGKLTTIRLILQEMLPPSGIPSPAQRLLLRIKAVAG